jgi:LacI family transcriptional regulator
MKDPVQSLIAERLNMSQSSVSRALRNKPGIRPEVCERVREVAREMGYRIPSADRRERGSVSATQGDSGEAALGRFVGVLVHSPHRRWTRSGYFTGLSDSAPKLNASLVMHHVETSECESVLDPACQPPVMRSGAFAGIVLLFRWPREVVAELCSRNYRMVSLQHEYPGLPVDVVKLDNAAGAQSMVEHLHGLGHKRIGFFGRSGELTWSRSRFQGFVDAAFQHGVEFSTNRVIEVESRLLERYEEFGPLWDPHIDRVEAMVRKEGVRAWVSSSDWVGYCLCRGLMDRGLKVPEDLSITGFDSADVEELGCPRLTSVRVPLEEMGAAALARILERPSPGVPGAKAPGGDPNVQVVFKGVTEMGRTTASPRSAS